MRLASCILGLWLWFNGLTIHAQPAEYLQHLQKNKWLLETGYSNAIPSAAFANQISRSGHGFFIAVGKQFGKSPFSWGARFDFIRYGYQTNRSIFNPAHDLIVERHQFMMPALLFIRLSPVEGKFKPYAELAGGSQLIASRTNAIGQQLIYQPNHSGNFSVMDDFYDFNATASLGAGVTYWLESLGDVSYHIQLGGRWLYGSSAQYLGIQDLQVNGNQLIYSAKESPISYFSLHIGLSATF
jgi:hypothetical protein